MEFLGIPSYSMVFEVREVTPYGYLARNLSCIFWGVVILDLLVRYTPVYPRRIQRRNACLCSHLASLSLPQAAAAIAL